MKKILFLAIVCLTLFTGCKPSYVEKVKNTTFNNGATVEQVVRNKFEALEFFEFKERPYTDKLIDFDAARIYNYNPRIQKDQLKWKVDGKTLLRKVVRVESDNFYIMISTFQDGDYVVVNSDEIIAYSKKTNKKIDEKRLNYFHTRLFSEILNNYKYSVNKGITSIYLHNTIKFNSISDYNSAWNRNESKDYLHRAEFKNGEIDGIYNISYLGTPISEENFKQGRLSGISKYYYTNGKLASEGNYQNGYLEGSHKAYDYKSGQLERERTFKNYKLDGLYKIYHENGKVFIEANFKEGRPEGSFKQYYDDGTLWEEANFKEGKLEGSHKRYYKSGKLERESYFVDDMLEGQLTGYNEDSTLAIVANFKGGYPDGSLKGYQENGTPLIDGNFKNNSLEGIYKVYHENGTLMIEADFKDGNREAKYKEYTDSGKLKKEGTLISKFLYSFLMDNINPDKINSKNTMRSFGMEYIDDNSYSYQFEFYPNGRIKRLIAPPDGGSEYPNIEYSNVSINFKKLNQNINSLEKDLKNPKKRDMETEIMMSFEYESAYIYGLSLSQGLKEEEKKALNDLEYKINKIIENHLGI